MPTDRSGGGVGVIDGKIYVAGGRPPRGNDFAVYDPAADRWTVLPMLPTGRNHLAVDAIGGKLYVAGGRFDARGKPDDGRARIFDPASGTWTGGAPMPAARGGVTGIAAFGCLYVIAGEGNLADPAACSIRPRPTTRGRTPGTAWARCPCRRTASPAPRSWMAASTSPAGSVTVGGNNGTTLHQVYEPQRRCDQ